MAFFGCKLAWCRPDRRDADPQTCEITGAAPWLAKTTPPMHPPTRLRRKIEASIAEIEIRRIRRRCLALAAVATAVLGVLLGLLLAPVNTS